MTIPLLRQAFRKTIKATLLLLALLIQSVSPLNALENSWTKPGSGNWEEPFWSLGILPATGQSILITNAGWKAVMIGPSVSQSYPQSLTVDAITLSSPTNSLNTLLLNYAGLDVPLTVKSVSINTNSAMTLLSSALFLNGSSGTGMSVGGEFNQRELSVVTGTQFDVGYNGPGTYNLAGGSVSVGHAWIGGPFHGVFNQTGGSNGIGILHLDGGDYNLIAGDFAPEIYFNGGTLRQQGSRINRSLTLYRGTYVLENGVHDGNTVIPISDGWAIAGGYAQVLQTGGTNLGAIQMGMYGSGFYTLSNGVVVTPALTVNYYGSFNQWGGTVTTTGKVSLLGGTVNRGDRALGYYTLGNGTLSSAELFLDTGYFTQSGGTNTIAGDLHFQFSTHNYYRLNGGLLMDSNTIVDAAWVGGFFQAGGRHVIANQLSISSSQLPFWYNYSLSGGELVVSNIWINPGAVFDRTGGTIEQSGTLTLFAGNFHSGPGEQQFGPLQLIADSANSNSVLRLPTAACVVHLGDSSDRAWSLNARLIVTNWAGSASGGGSQQVIFGSDETGLTAQQVNQIFFSNPAGSPEGIYAARLLPTGEIVPQQLSPTGSIAPRVTIHREADQSITVSVQGNPGSNYGIEWSTDMVHWTPWTNQPAPSGTMSVTDTPDATSPARFYRAVLMP
jgi:hypothetical protein